MHRFIFNLLTATESGPSCSCARRVGGQPQEHHRDALAPGDLALVFVAVTREFVGRVELKTTFLDPISRIRRGPTSTNPAFTDP
jgi:hypothetical protein